MAPPIRDSAAVISDFERPVRQDLRLREKSAGLKERLIEFMLGGCGMTAILVTIGIVYVLAGETVHFFSDVSPARVFGDTTWTPLFSTNAHFGIWTLISGTVLTAFIAMMVALPLGLLAAIYLSEFAAPRTRKVVKPVLEILAGVPTIVYGFFALTIVTPMLKTLLPSLPAFNALAPGLVMGIMIVPMVASLSEDAMFAVPRALREASLGLGSSKLAMIRRVVIPSAWSGIVAALILAVSRAIGETMIVAVAAGQSTSVSFNPTEQASTMTSYMANIAMGDLPTDSLGYRTIFMVGSLLFVLTLVMNVISHYLSRRLRAAGRV